MNKTVKTDIGAFENPINIIIFLLVGISLSGMSFFISKNINKPGMIYQWFKNNSSNKQLICYFNYKSNFIKRKEIKEIRYGFVVLKNNIYIPINKCKLQ